MSTTKITLNLFVLVFFVTSCAKFEFDPDGSVIIAGKILNCHDSLSNVSAQIYSNGIHNLESSTIHFPIHPDGTFRHKIYHPHAKDIYLSFGNRGLYLYAHPSDSIFVRFDARKFVTSGFTPINIDSLYISGSRTDISYSINKFVQEINTLVPENEYTDYFLKLVPAEYFNHREKRYKQEVALLEHFLTAHPSPREFQNWAADFLQYRFANDLLSQFNIYRASGHRIKSFPEETKEVVNSLERNDMEKINCGEFQSFLSNYMSTFLINEGINTGQAEYIHRDVSGNTGKAVDFINTKTDGFSREYFLTKQLNTLLDHSLIEDFEKYYETYKENIKTEFFKELLTSRYELTKNAMRNNNTDQVRLIDFSDSTFQSFMEKFKQIYKGKLVYTDIWATWCGSCIHEFPDTHRLKEELPEEVVFTYIAVESNKSHWEKIIKRYNISGDHLFLNNHQVKELKKQIKYPSIPFHFLLTQEGNFVTDNALSPRNEGAKPLISDYLTK